MMKWLGDFCREHIVGMIIFALATSVAGSYIWQEISTPADRRTGKQTERIGQAPDILGRWAIKTQNLKEGGTVSGEVVFLSAGRAQIIVSGSPAYTQGRWNYDQEHRKIMLFDDDNGFTTTLMWSPDNPQFLSGKDQSGDTWMLTRLASK